MPINKLVILLVSLIIIGGIFFFIFRSIKEKHDSNVVKDIIKKIENRKKYSELTLEILNQIQDSEIEFTIIDFILDNKMIDYNKEIEIVESMSKGLQYFYTTWIFESEVNNGGFNQYFYNTSGVFASKALKGLEVFQATTHAELLKRAITIYENEKEMHLKTKESGSIEDFSESYEKTELTKLDDEFFNIKEDLSKLRIHYIRTHLSEFVCK
jgi:hypothetical protein